MRRSRAAVDQQDLLNKLAQIEEQARTTLAELPNTHLIKERMRMVVALTRYMRTAVAGGGVTGVLSETTSRPSDNDDREQGTG